MTTRRRRRGWRRRRVAVVVAVLTLLAGAGAAAAAARSGADDKIDHPLVREVDVGGHPVTVVVTPGRPGRNLVQAFSPHGIDVTLPGGSMIDLPDGATDIDLVVGPRSAPLAVRTRGPGSTGPVDEECASRALGAAVAHRSIPSRCASPPGDAEAVGAALVEAAHDAGIGAVLIRSDRTARGRAAVAGAVGEARRLGLPARTSGAPRSDEAMVVLGGWVEARSVLASAAPGRGSFLAPWLLEQHVLAAATSQVSVASAIAPSSPVARAYLAALAAAAPGATPSAAGLAAFAGSPPATVLQLWTPADIAFLPPALSAGHDHAGHDGPTSWLAQGRLALVRSALPLRPPP